MGTEKVLGSWLDRPLQWPAWDGKPDPLLYVGRHRTCIVLAGQVVTHQQWGTTHEGACLPGCRPYQVLTHAKQPRRLRRATRKPETKPQLEGIVKPLDFGGDPYA